MTTTIPDPIEAKAPQHPELNPKLILLVCLALYILLVLARPSIPRYGMHDVLVERIALQVRDGYGMVFNRGEPYLLIFEPVLIILVALVGSLTVVLVSTFAGAAVIYEFAKRIQVSPWAAIFCALVFVNTLLERIPSTTTLALCSALTLVGLLLIMDLRGFWSGVVLGLAALSTLQALVPALAFFICALQLKQGRRYALGFSLTFLSGILALTAHFGFDLDYLQGLTLNPPLTYVWAFSPPHIALYMAIAAATALVGWFRQRSVLLVQIIALWIVLYILIFGIVLGNLETISYIPILGPMLVLSGVVIQRWKWWLVAALVIIVEMCGYIQVGSAQSQGQSEKSKIASIGIDAVSGFGYRIFARASPDQRVVSLDGRLNPEIRRMTERGDYRSILIRYAPRVLWLEKSFRRGFDFPFLIKLGYWPEDLEPRDEDLYIDRGFEYPNFTGRFTVADVAYGLDFRLIEVELDRESLTPGQIVRFRLAWDLARPAARPVDVEIDLQTDEAVVTSIRDTVEPGVFRDKGRYDTYHVLKVPADLKAGSVRVRVAMHISGGLVNRATMATVGVLPPEKKP